MLCCLSLLCRSNKHGNTDLWHEIVATTLCWLQDRYSRASRQQELLQDRAQLFAPLCWLQVQSSRASRQQELSQNKSLLSAPYCAIGSSRIEHHLFLRPTLVGDSPPGHKSQIRVEGPSMLRQDQDESFFGPVPETSKIRTRRTARPRLYDVDAPKSQHAQAGTYTVPWVRLELDTGFMIDPRWLEVPHLQASRRRNMYADTENRTMQGQ